MTAIGSTPILALALGHYKSVACAYDPATALARFHTLPTSAADRQRLLDGHRPTVVVVEACPLAGWVHDLCQARGVEGQVANTASEAGKFQHAKRKTDRDDALRLAQLAALKQLPGVYVPDVATRQWRALIAHRQTLVGLRVAAQNRVRALLVGQGWPAPRGARAWTELGLQGLAALARPLAECGPEELWRGVLDQVLAHHRTLVAATAAVEARLAEVATTQPAVARLQTISGVGPRTAEAVAAYLPQPRRFRSGQEVGAYAGLVPRPYQSGESDRRGRITRRGPGLLRKLRVECAWGLLRYNGWARAVYARLSRGQARKKPAIVALARKLLVRCWAMLRDGTDWREAPQPAAG